MADDSLLSEPAAAPAAPAAAPTGTVITSSPGTMTPDVTPVADWKTTIPEELRNEKLWTKFNNQGDAFKSLVNLEKRLGSAVNIPTDKSTSEERDSFYSKLGRPTKPEDYKLDLPALPEGMNWTGMDAVKAEAHQLGLTDAQFNGLMKHHVKVMTDMVPDRGKQIADCRETLTKEWGGVFDRNLAFARREASQHPEFIAALKTAGLDNHPDVVKLLAKFGGARAEHAFVDGDRQADVGKGDAAKEHASLMADKNGAYWNKSNPGHKEAVERAYYLNQIIHNAI